MRELAARDWDRDALAARAAEFSRERFLERLLADRGGRALRTLVTGAGGFAGRHLLRELGDDAVAGAADVTDAQATLAAIEAARPDAVAHLAALSSVAESLARPPRSGA